MPLFSVVICSYNRAQFIVATLDSLRAQEFTDCEVILVDDGSTDNTLELVRQYPEVKIFTQKNKGPGVARNVGVSKAAGRYIAFLDSDDLWFPWTLSTFAEAISKHGEPDLVSAQLELFWEDAELDKVKREPLTTAVFPDYYASSRNRFFVGACMMTIRKEVFEAAGGFTEKRIYAEDCDLALRFGLVNGFVQISKPVTLGYRQHQTNASRNHALIFAGIMNLVDSERAGVYPGGSVRELDRWRLVTLHVRPFAVECLAKAGVRWRGWSLYFKTLGWHLWMRRWKFVIGFPVLALWRLFRKSHQA